MPLRELFQLVSFTQFQQRTLSRHGVDTAVLADLGDACLRQLESMCQVCYCFCRYAQSNLIISAYETGSADRSTVENGK
jgi:hypothetical protein